MGIREEQKEKRRDEILMAGLDLFIHKGYAATRVSDIAQRVGMSVGLLFHYFESKEKLYEQLIYFGTMGPMNMMADRNLPPLEFFEQSASQLFQYLKNDPFVAKMFVLMSQAFYSEAVTPTVKEMLSGFDIYTPTTELIRRGQEQGTIRPGDPRGLAIAYWCAIQGIAEQLAMHPECPCPESEWVVDIIRNRETEPSPLERGSALDWLLGPC